MITVKFRRPVALFTPTAVSAVQASGSSSRAERALFMQTPVENALPVHRGAPKEKTGQAGVASTTVLDIGGVNGKNEGLTGSVAALVGQ